MDIKKLILPLAIFVFIGCSDSSNNKDQNASHVQNTQDIKYPIKLKTLDVNNTIIVNKTNKGFSFSNKKATFVVFMASWCPPCKAQLPHLNNLQKKYSKKLDIIGVLLDEKSLNEVKKFKDDYNIDFTLAVGKENFTFAKAAGDVKAVPFMILYDKQGNYATHYTGAVLEEMLDVDIKKVIK